MRAPRIGMVGLMSALAALAVYAQDAPPAAAGRGGNQVRLEPPVPTGPPTNSAPNPYRTITGWFQVPEGRVFLYSTLMQT